MTDLVQTHTRKSPDAVIRPQWWTGTPAIDPSRYVLDAGGSADPTELGPRLKATFDEVGLVHVVNTGLRDHSDMRALAKTVVDAEMDYRGGANPRASLEPNVYEIGAPLTAALHYHHEMAYVGASTEMVAFLAKAAVPGRG
ncbi:MAG: hypothetical protein AAFO29_26345, partial [Actinomycetota bacterium]